jgi:hypothetical protein
MDTQGVRIFQIDRAPTGAERPAPRVERRLGTGMGFAARRPHADFVVVQPVCPEMSLVVVLLVAATVTAVIADLHHYRDP